MVEQTAFSFFCQFLDCEWESLQSLKLVVIENCDKNKSCLSDTVICRDKMRRYAKRWRFLTSRLLGLWHFTLWPHVTNYDRRMLVCRTNVNGLQRANDRLWFGQIVVCFVICCGSVLWLFSNSLSRLPLRFCSLRISPQQAHQCHILDVISHFALACGGYPRLLNAIV